MSVSSTHPGSTPNPPAFTDGLTSGSYAVHTAREENPWAQIDLGETYRINKVKIYNRGDGWFDDGLPMTLEFSENGTDFTEIDKRTKSFGQRVPGMADRLGKKPARYVRIDGNRGGYVALNEIEVFGKK